MRVVGLVPFLTLLSTPCEAFAIPSSFSTSTSSTTSLSSTRTPYQPNPTIMDAPYGSWTSPITSKAITAGSVGLGGIMLDGSDLLWQEGRPQEGGRNVLCKFSPESSTKSERGAVDVTPAESNVRTRVHEYGGAAVTLTPDSIMYSEFSTQRLHALHRESGVSTPLTPEGDRYRFADGVHDAKQNRLLMVREDHEKPDPVDVVNEIASVSLEDGSMQTLATGRDFYAAPRLSPDGTKLAYMTWNHPSMPWDATQLRLLTLDPDGSCASTATNDHELIAGSDGDASILQDGDTSILQPLWHPTSGELYYLSDQSGYYNLYKQGSSASILPMEADFGGSAPGWMLGQQGYEFLADGRLMATYVKEGKSVLLLANVLDSDTATEIVEYGMADGLPMQFGGVTSRGSTLYFMGGTPAAPGGVYSWDLETRGPAVLLASSSTLQVPESVVSVPEQVVFPCPMGEAYGYYYKPKNDGFVCSSESAPPLLVKAHGGPTACTGTSFNAGIQYWTSRGFAVLDVDYGGSTGYGRDYRRRLRGNWGIVDIDDVCAGAKYLVEKGLADEKRLAIDGGSAGGYTTLGALAFRNVFTAGTSLYGVASLEALAQDTHKFESRYLDGLIGEYPKEEVIYKARAPIEHVDTLDCPILLLQGDEDKIVPPNQAEKMHEALLKKGIPTALRMYVGEQHGFRKAENIEDSLDSELYFYSKVYGFDAKGIKPFPIDNLD